VNLGIYVTNNLKWSHHIAYIQHNASICAFQILKSFSTKNVWILLKAFTTFVRPKL